MQAANVCHGSSDSNHHPLPKHTPLSLENTINDIQKIIAISTWQSSEALLQQSVHNIEHSTVEGMIGRIQDII